MVGRRRSAAKEKVRRWHTDDAVCAEHGRAFQRYLERDFNAAAGLYENVQDMQPERTDIAAALLQERCEKYADAPPGPDWKGVEVLKQKTFDA